MKHEKVGRSGAYLNKKGVNIPKVTNLHTKASGDLGIHSSQEAIELFKSSSTLTDLPSICTARSLESGRSDWIVTKQTNINNFYLEIQYTCLYTCSLPLTEQSRVTPLTTMLTFPFQFQHTVKRFPMILFKVINFLFEITDFCVFMSPMLSSPSTQKGLK